MSPRTGAHRTTLTAQIGHAMTSPHSPAPTAAPTALPQEQTVPAQRRRRVTVPPVRQALLTGVGYMVPVVVTGGSLVALAHLLGGSGVAGLPVVAPAPPPAGTPLPGLDDLGWPGLLHVVGSTALSMLVPVLAGFVAFALAGPVALVAGLVGGLLAAAVGAGYLGGLLAGLLAGAVTLLLARVPVPAAAAGLSSVVVVPVVSTLLVGVAVLEVVGPPVAAAQAGVTAALAGLTGSSAALLGLALGAMVAVDLGGPVNKLAYTSALAALAAGDGQPMAAVAAAGMVPPLGLALAAQLRPAAFTSAEQAAGRACWFLGPAFVTEGAIPFAAADPLRVVPSAVAGSAVAGGLTMTAGASTLVPHGGLWLLGGVTEPLLYLGAALVGTGVTAGCVLATKARRRPSASLAVRAVPPAPAPRRPGGTAGCR